MQTSLILCRKDCSLRYTLSAKFPREGEQDHVWPAVYDWSYKFHWIPTIQEWTPMWLYRDDTNQHGKCSVFHCLWKTSWIYRHSLSKTFKEYWLHDKSLSCVHHDVELRSSVHSRIRMDTIWYILCKKANKKTQIFRKLRQETVWETHGPFHTWYQGSYGLIH